MAFPYVNCCQYATPICSCINFQDIMKTTWLTYRYCRCRAHSSQAERSTILTCFEQRSLESCSMWCLLWCPALMIWSQDVGWLIGFELAIGYKVTIKVESIFVQTLLVTIVFYLSNAMSGGAMLLFFSQLKILQYTHIIYHLTLPWWWKSDPPPRHHPPSNS